MASEPGAAHGTQSASLTASGRRPAARTRPRCPTPRPSSRS